MTVAVLQTSVALDPPRRPYVGPEDVITGNVVVKCLSGTTAGIPEVFGPLKLVVVLHGRAKSKIIKNNGQNRSTYRGRAPLIRASAVVHNDSFKGVFGSTYKFPFAVAFPPKTQLGAGLFDLDGGLFDSTPGRPLPPTMALSYHGFAHRFDCFVAYQLQLMAGMPGIDVKVNGTDAEYPIRYEMPRIPIDARDDRLSSWTRRICVSNAHLLPPGDRPSGLKEKTKALFSSDYYPRHIFEATFSSPQHLYVSSRPRFSISIRHLDDSTAPVVPDVILKSFSVSLKAYTEVRAEKQIFSEPTSHGDESLWGSVKGVIGPFEKSRDWTWDVRATTIPPRIPPSFKTYNINRSYRLKVSWIVRCAEKDFTLEQSHNVILKSPLMGDSSAEQGTSQQGYENFTEMGDVLPGQDPQSEDRLPTYQEAADQDRASLSSADQPPAFSAEDVTGGPSSSEVPPQPLPEDKGKGSVKTEEEIHTSAP